MRMIAEGADAMKIESEKHRLDAHRADLSGSRFDDVNLSGSFEDLDMSDWRVHKADLAGAAIVDDGLEGATINGVTVTGLLAYWQAGRGAKGA